jgi:hypothetical protein
MSVLSELEPFQARQPRQRPEKPGPRGTGSLNMVRPGSSGDNWNSEKGKKHVTLSVPSSTSDIANHDRGRIQKPTVSAPENPSTASDSNSHSDDSNDEVYSASTGRSKNGSETQSKRESDASRQSHVDATELDPSLDPKKAKR